MSSPCHIEIIVTEQAEKVQRAAEEKKVVALNKRSALRKNRLAALRK
jgi:hypothetical protein